MKEEPIEELYRHISSDILPKLPKLSKAELDLGSHYQKETINAFGPLMSFLKLKIEVLNLDIV